MTDNTQNPGGWDGYPENPERDGPHVIRHKDSGDEWTALWHCGEWIDASSDFGPSHAAIYYDYIGPCLTPAEVAARVEAARREGIAAAANAVRELEPHLSALKARDYPDDMLILLDDAERAIRALLEDGR